MKEASKSNHSLWTTVLPSAVQNTLQDHRFKRLVIKEQREA